MSKVSSDILSKMVLDYPRSSAQSPWNLPTMTNEQFLKGKSFFQNGTNLPWGKAHGQKCNPSMNASIDRLPFLSLLTAAQDQIVVAYMNWLSFSHRRNILPTYMSGISLAEPWTRRHVIHPLSWSVTILPFNRAGLLGTYVKSDISPVD